MNSLTKTNKQTNTNNEKKKENYLRTWQAE